jgi:hypothetical protein
MDIFRRSVSDVGFELIERTLGSTDSDAIHRELFVIHNVSKMDKKKVFLFADPADVDLIRMHERTLDTLPDNVKYMYVWDNKIYALMEKMDMTLQQWVLFFTKAATDKCIICLEDIGEEVEDAARCPHCYEVRCRDCDVKQKLSECPVCRKLDPSSYLFKRYRTFNGILATSGIAEAASKKENRRGCRRIVKEKFPEFTTVDDMIDALLEMQGFRLYPLDPMYGNAWDAFDGAY